MTPDLVQGIRFVQSVKTSTCFEYSFIASQGAFLEQNFVSAPAVRQFLEKNKVAQNDPLGRISLNKNDDASWRFSFYTPLGPRTPAFRTGAASFLEALVLEKFIAQYGDCVIRSRTPRSDPRARQLIRRGVKVDAKGNYSISASFLLAKIRRVQRIQRAQSVRRKRASRFFGRFFFRSVKKRVIKKIKK